MIHLIKTRVSKNQIAEMMEALGGYIKVAVDTRLGILAGGGVMHADCEEILLKSGSKQADVWGADWHPENRNVTFKSLINIRPRQDNRSMEIQNPKIRADVEKVIRNLLTL